MCEIYIFNCLAIFLVERKEEEKNLKEHERRKEGKKEREEREFKFDLLKFLSLGFFFFFNK